MTDTLVIFSPREMDLIGRAKNGGGQNAAVLQELLLKIDKYGEAHLDADFVNRLKGAARNWSDGYELALKGVLNAIERHA